MCFQPSVQQDDGGARAAAEAQLQAQREQIKYQQDLYDKEQARIAQEKADAAAAEAQAKAAAEAQLAAEKANADTAQKTKDAIAQAQAKAQMTTGAGVSTPSSLTESQKAAAAAGLAGFSDLQKKAARQLGFDQGLYQNQGNTLQSSGTSLGGRSYY